ncbi:MAG TPA: alpha-L-arabinofuranosidase C-terminal domain-containing protein [Longimicrobiaceae bacterium]
MDRRTFVKSFGAAALTVGGTERLPIIHTGARSAASLVVDPTPKFEISPYLYMQFMEPLGTTDGSVEASWDYAKDDWREDLVAATSELAPDVIRWGGNFIRWYRWREGVGPVAERPWMYNLEWGGKETNRVGTHEFVDFCRRVGAEPLMCVNFLSDGHKEYWNTIHGENRTGDANEAADWVSYANDPDNAERRRHGVDEPYNIRLWQIGNETSYGDRGFPRDEAIQHTIEFARAMRARDPSIQLLGWGDDYRRGGFTGDYWAPAMLDRAGEYLDYIALHMMGMSPQREDTVLRGFEYQKDPERAWEEMLELTGVVERRLKEIREIVDAHGPDKGIAITEGHVSFDPHNANPILQEWLSAVYHARTMNLYLRNGDRVKICTGADFAGTRWTVNAVQIPVPRGQSFLLPIATIMRLFNRHKGSHGVMVRHAPPELDVTASRDENTVYLHVLNTSYRNPVEASLEVEGLAIRGGRVHEIAPEDPRAYVDRNNTDTFVPVEKQLPPGTTTWRFPPRSVSVVELDVAVATAMGDVLSATSSAA